MKCFGETSADRRPDPTLYSHLRLYFSLSEMISPCADVDLSLVSFSVRAALASTMYYRGP